MAGEGNGATFSKKVAKKLLGEGVQGGVGMGCCLLEGRGGVSGRGDLRGSDFAGARSDSDRYFPCLIDSDAFFWGVLGSVSLFSE